MFVSPRERDTDNQNNLPSPRPPCVRCATAVAVVVVCVRVVPPLPLKSEHQHPTPSSYSEYPRVCCSCCCGCCAVCVWPPLTFFQKQLFACFFFFWFYLYLCRLFVVLVRVVCVVRPCYSPSVPPPPAGSLSGSLVSVVDPLPNTPRVPACVCCSLCNNQVTDRSSSSVLGVTLLLAYFPLCLYLCLTVFLW